MGQTCKKASNISNSSKNETTETPLNATEKQHHTMNTSIFQNHDNKCNGYTDCCCIKRIMEALSYYQQLSSTQPQKFIDFCDTYYSKQYLQDYIHCMCIHKNDINK
eukprot:424111_1